MKKYIVLFSLAVFSTQTVYAFQVSDLLETGYIKNKVEDALVSLDVKATADIFSFDLIDGINISTKYRYVVEPSYQDQFYTRIDKWDLKTDVNAGTILKDQFELPFGFNINKNNSFVFVRQFKQKSKAIEALPYPPTKVPINANKALKLNIGDFVSIPANLNLAFSTSVGTSEALGATVINANASAFFIVSGEYTLQVFKLDETHVRLKMISNRSLVGGTNGSVKADIDVAGFKIFANSNDNQDTGSGLGNKINKELDHQLQKQTIRLIDRLIDREFLNFGVDYTPGASYITDYVFDLSNKEAADAYNQILGSTYKIKNVIQVNNFLDAKNLKDKLITVTEMADKISESDKQLPVEQRRVVRIFKGFNNYKSTSRHLKLGLIFASYNRHTTFVENKLTFTDRNDKATDFYYPTFERFFETNFGKWFFSLKDQANQLYFGLIPRNSDETVLAKSPDIGLTFERKDSIFTTSEQKHVTKFMLNQLPTKIIDQIDFKDWRDGLKKLDSRIYFQVILKSQGFNELRKYSEKEIAITLIDYLKKKKLLHILVENKNKDNIDLTLQNKDHFEENEVSISHDTDATLEKMAGRMIEKGQIKTIAAILFHALHDADNVSEKTLSKILKLNEIPLFNKVGIGYLISLLPEEKLEDYVYVKLEMSAKEIRPLSTIYGKLNYQALYTEINAIQSRLSNRSYDLRIKNEDLDIENTENQDLP